jgi:DNA-binding transcriptional LysR family regulator
MERSDLALVVAVCDAGSLSAAAQLLDVAPPVVTKRLAALESRLGQRLFQRTTRRVTPTPEGETLCERARVLLQGFTALESELQERKAEPTGLIRLAATLGFGRRWVGPALAAFQAQHPHIDIQLQLTEQLPDLAREGLDGAIWLWQVDGRQASQWVSRRLASNRRVLVASPAYLMRHGTPDSVDALLQHACLIVRENGREGARDAARPTSQRFDVWQLHRHGDTTPARVRVHGPLSSNSGELVRDWCVAGHGIMLRSLWDIAPQLASGQLVQVLPDHCMPDADIHWLAPYRADAPRRIRLLIDFLLAEFQHEPWKAKAQL